MAIFYLILILLLCIFIICSFTAIIRFWRDTAKYSSYFNELVKLKEKAEKRVIINEEENEKND